MSFAIQQMAINLLLNTLSSSMDMVGLCPKYINIRRGSFIIMVVGVLIWPWKILASATAVIIFGSGWGCFCSGQTGIIIAKYFIVYKRKILLKDLYINSRESIYWFWDGIDWRSIFAFFLSIVFLMPGLAYSAKGESNGFWSWIFAVSYAWGMFMAIGSTLLLNWLFPGTTKMPDSKVDDYYNAQGDSMKRQFSYDEESVVSATDFDDVAVEAQEVKAKNAAVVLAA
ncbi:unnamed protein product [Ambrosiozyma monospora]|uniref:Unnamed protein product n=1 Tax=Ambrosiozyma monospora TaxID=43982 RepID=A0A9W6YYX2_AMBMO|nr:unnamed protein product [Ambrosiozyma monospora]